MPFTIRIMKMQKNSKKLIFKGDSEPLLIYYIALLYKNGCLTSVSIFAPYIMSEIHQNFTESSEHM